MSKNPHKKAIEVLADISPEDAHKYLFDIAASHPSALIAAVSKNAVKTNKNEIQDMILSITQSIMNYKSIEAIKNYRETTGVGFKEAKEFIDKLREIMGRM